MALSPEAKAAILKSFTEMNREFGNGKNGVWLLTDPEELARDTMAAGEELYRREHPEEKEPDGEER